MKCSMYKKITATILSLIIISSSLCTTSISWASEIQLSPEKHETVYINLNPDGSKRNVIDSTWIQNSRELKNFKDNTILKNVESVSGAKLLENNNGNLVWDTNGDDVYYQSPIDKKIPVDVKIEYFLDGKKMSPDKIAGKSGRVKIHIALKNNDKHGDLYTPFTSVTVIPLKNDVFSDVSVTDGKIFSDGNSKMVICIGFPSLEEVLDLKNENIDQLKDLNFPDEFTIEANVKEFELATIGIAISPEIPDAIKDMDNDEDIKKDIEDINTLIEAKDTIKQVDPNDTLKKFVRDNNKTQRSRELIDDLYDFYDLDTSILEELPEFVTHKNIELFDKLKDDAKKYYAEDILDNEIIRNIPKRIDAQNIAKAEKLIKWHDEFKKFDEDRLSQIDKMIDNRPDLVKFMDEAEDLMDIMENHDDDIKALEALMNQRTEIEALIESVDNSGMSNMISSIGTSGSAITTDDIAWLEQQLINRKLPVMQSQVLNQYSQLFNVDGLLGPSQKQDEFKLFVQKGVSGGLITSGAAISINRAIDADRITLIPLSDRRRMEAMVKPIIEQKVEQELTNRINIGRTLNKTKNLVNQINSIKVRLSSELGSNYKTDIRNALNFVARAKGRIRRIDGMEQKYHNQIEQAKDVMHDKKTLDYLEEWKDKLEEARDDIDMNDSNVEVMRDLINEYKKPKVKQLYDNIPVLLDDIDAIRPVASKFNDMLEKPRNDKIIHDMPETLPILIRMRQDILKNRDITDALAIGTDQRVINAAKKVLDVIDSKDRENKLDEMKEQLDSLENLLDKKDELIKLSDDYDTFAGKSADIKSHVSFILKTDSIEIPEEPKENIDETENEEKSGSFIDWIASLFTRLFAMLNFWSA